MGRERETLALAVQQNVQNSLWCPVDSQLLLVPPLYVQAGLTPAVGWQRGDTRELESAVQFEKC